MILEPEGFSLLAARRLLRAIGDAPLDIERLALLLDGELNYGWAVRLISLVAESQDAQPVSFHECYAEGAIDFRDWAKSTLLSYPSAEAT